MAQRNLFRNGIGPDEASGDGIQEVASPEVPERMAARKPGFGAVGGIA
jgi:hypothetical protein